MEELNGYAPPVSLNLNDFQYEIGDAVAKAIAKSGIQVNQEELLKALKYDRGQYKAGYDAGFADGFIETLHIVRCRDCKYWGDDAGTQKTSSGEAFARCVIHNHLVDGRHVGWCPKENDFCSCGERKGESVKKRERAEALSRWG